MTAETDGGDRRAVAGETERRRRAVLGKLLAAVLVAMPGAYAAVRTQDSADAGKLRTEVVVRDRQEDAFRRHFEVIRTEIRAVREAAVTHRELLDVIVKFRARTTSARPRSPARRAAASVRERELEEELRALRTKERTARAAGRRTAAAQRALPRLRPAAVVRRDVERKMAF